MACHRHQHVAADTTVRHDRVCNVEVRIASVVGGWVAGWLGGWVAGWLDGWVTSWLGD
jgi:hypothetical protein